jgi:sugar phosphate isomerase/epimerase
MHCLVNVENINMRKWSLDQLSTQGVRPAELVEIAAVAGYDAISPFIGLGDNGGVWTVPLRAGARDTLEMKRALADTGVALANVDGFVLSPDMNMAEVQAGVFLAAQLGASNVGTLLFDPDLERGFSRFNEICSYASEAGIGVVLEFMGVSGLPGPSEALRWIDRVGGTHVGLQVDLLHLDYAHGTPTDIKKLDPALIRSAQVCDGPTHPDFGAYRHSAVYERLPPGEGEFPIGEFLAALPQGVTVGVEVPTQAKIKGKTAHIERTRDLLWRARSIASAARA